MKNAKLKFHIVTLVSCLLVAEISKQNAKCDTLTYGDSAGIDFSLTTDTTINPSGAYAQSGVISLPQFDSSLGTLTQVQVIVLATALGGEELVGSAQYDNLYTVSVSGLGGSASWSWTETLIAEGDPWQGQIPGLAETGQSEIDTSDQGNGIQFVDYEYSNSNAIYTSNLGDFIGSGGLEYDISAASFANFVAGDAEPFAVTLVGEADVDIIYTYTPYARDDVVVFAATQSVPEPVSLSSFAAGIGVLILRRHR